MSLKSLLLGFVIGIVVLPLGAWLYLKLGYAPVATSSPRRLLRKTGLEAD